MEVYSHESPLRAGKPNRNGAYWYSVEICKNIIPYVETDRPWVTIKLGDFCVDHAIYFIHDNLTPQRYEFLRKYKDIVAVCGLEETCGKVCAYVENCIYLPLSVDIKFVQQFERPKDKLACYAGRKGKPGWDKLDPAVVDMLCNMDRTSLLTELGRYRYVFAVGRTAIEAAILGCQVLPFDPRFPAGYKWPIISNQEAAAILQRKLDAIDKRKKQ